MADSPKTYEVTPFRAIVPAMPVQGPSGVDADELRAGQFKMTGVESVETSLDGARRNTERLLRDWRARSRARDRYALIALLDDNPELMLVEEVRAELIELIRGGLPLRRRGRRRNRYRMHPLVVVGIVRQLVHSKVVPNTEQAFWWLNDKDVLPYETARRLFYRSAREERLRPLLVEFPELSERLPSSVVEPVLRAAEVLTPRRPILRRWNDPVRGETELSINAR
jgi:hypothetical protein